MRNYRYRIVTDTETILTIDKNNSADSTIGLKNGPFYILRDEVEFRLFRPPVYKNLRRLVVLQISEFDQKLYNDKINEEVEAKKENSLKYAKKCFDTGKISVEDYEAMVTRSEDISISDLSHAVIRHFKHSSYVPTNKFKVKGWSDNIRTYLSLDTGIDYSDGSLYDFYLDHAPAGEKFNAFETLDIAKLMLELAIQSDNNGSTTVYLEDTPA